MSAPETKTDDQREQEDIRAILSVWGTLTNINILATYRGDTATDVDLAVGSLGTAGGKDGGACIIVLEPEAPRGSTSPSAIIFERLHRVRVLEERAINKLPDGTLLCGKNAYQLRNEVIRALHGQYLGSAMLMFRRFEPFKFIETDDAGSELRTQNGWTVDFAIEAQLDSDRKSADPRITQAAGTITITAAGNAGEVIRYTTDGTAPVPGGATVQTYSAPFTAPASGTLLRAASTATGMPLSGITEAIVA